MFGDSNDDLRQTMVGMWHHAYNKHCANKVAAADTVVSQVTADPRFARFDAGKLVDRFQERLGSGGKLDFDDPALHKGGFERPCQTKGGRY